MQKPSPLYRLAAAAASDGDAVTVPVHGGAAAESMPPPEQQQRAAPAVAALGVGSTAEIRVLEVDAFASVQDLIHAAIASKAGAATLKDVYQLCQHSGRIAYKRSGGSRLITDGPHWKSQIRHALYTCERFQRVPGSAELWQLTPAHAASAAQTQRVLVRAEEAAASVTVSAAPSSTVAAGGRPTGSGGAPAAATATPSSKARPPAGTCGSAKRRRAGRRLSPGAEEEGRAVSAASPLQPAAARSPCLATPPPLAPACSVGAAEASPALSSLAANDGSVLQDCTYRGGQCHDSPLAPAATDVQQQQPRQRRPPTAGRQQRAASAAAQSPAADAADERFLHGDFASAAAASPAPPSTRQRRSQQQQAAASATAAGQPAPGGSPSDPSTLRWGHKALRSTFTITIAPSPSHPSAVGVSDGSHASLVAAVRRGLRQAQAASSEAEPQAHAHLLYRRSAPSAADVEAGRAAKRRTLQLAATQRSPEADTAAAVAAAAASLPLLLSLLHPVAAATAVAAATGALPASLQAPLPNTAPCPPLAGIPAPIPNAAALQPSGAQGQLVQGQLAAALLAAAASGAATPVLGHAAAPGQ